MDRFEIEGGFPLRGRVQVSGAKNAALPLLAATLLTDEPCEVSGIPDLRDVRTMRRLLEGLGVRIEDVAPGTWRTQVHDSSACRADREWVKTMRASICVLGPLLGRRDRAEVSFPGGCVIGPRPVDLHLSGLEGLGARVAIREGYIHATWDTRQPGEREIYLGGPFGPTVLGTANILCAAVLTPGSTCIQAAACEPEIVDLCRFLVAMGADIEGIGSPTLLVQGVERLRGAQHRIIPDRIEAGTLLAAGAITGGDIEVAGADPRMLTAPLTVLRRMGVRVERGGDSVLRVYGDARPKPVDLVTLPYPGFPTDLQAQWMALLAHAQGNSFVTEKIYPERFIHVAELQRMGARIRKEGPTAIISGVASLSGCPVMASDLRASAALVLAGLAAEGTTTVERVYHIDRGYERIETKLAELGAHIRRTQE